MGNFQITQQTIPDSGFFLFGCASDSTGQYLVVCGYNTDTAIIYTSTDYGVTWIQRTIPNNVNIQLNGCASDSNGKNLVVCGYNIGTAIIYTSSDYGVTWIQQTIPNNVDIRLNRCASDSSGQHLVACGYNFGTAIIYTSSDYGVTWIQQTIPNNVDIRLQDCASDSSGQHLVASGYTNTDTAVIYTSTDYGVTWIQQTIPNNVDIQLIGCASDSSGKNLVACGAKNGNNNNNLTAIIYTSSDYGFTWIQQTIPNNLLLGFTSVSSDLTGQNLIASGTNILTNDNKNSFANGVIYTSSDYGVNWLQQTNIPDNNNNLLYSNASNSTGKNIIVSGTKQNDTEIPTAVIYTLVDTTIPCFKEDTKILTNKGYIAIQELRNGDLIKTYKNGFIPISIIGFQKLPNQSDTSKNILYLAKQSEYPELYEDLVITGYHSILVDKLSFDQMKEINKLFGRVSSIEDKYLLPICFDKNASLYKKTNDCSIYHIALECDNENKNYGIYANGLLVESISNRQLKQFKNMKFRK